MFVTVMQLRAEPVVRGAAGDVQAPQGAKLVERIAIGLEDLVKVGVHGLHGPTRGSPLLEDASGLPDVPVVVVDLQSDELGVAQFREVGKARARRLTVDDLVDATRVEMHAVVSV